MQTALRPNNSREACCCFLLFEPADADGADDSVVPDIASQDSCCRRFQQVQSCLSAFVDATRNHHAG